MPALWRRLVAEFLGSALLAAVVIGSGIAAQQLSPGAIGLELLENAAVTAAGLYVLIVVFAPISGAHFNPVVSAVDASLGGIPWSTAAWYVPAQVVGCIGGAVLANVMFNHEAISISNHHRATSGHLVAETVATAGLILVIFALSRTGQAARIPAAVGSFIGAAYWFTSSTSFANPAITIGRMFSKTFAGIAPVSVAPFIAVQVLGAAIATGLVKVLYPSAEPRHRVELATPPDPGLVTLADGDVVGD